MRILVIGAVAAGTSAAAKARRNDDLAEIVIYEKDTDISYSGCGLPYYIGGKVKDIAELTPRNPGFFKKKYNIDVKIAHEVLNVDPELKEVEVKNLETGKIFKDKYDKLILATGAKAFVPPVKGFEKEHVFTLRNVQNARAIRDFVVEKKPKKAVIAGSGFIGFELLENFVNLGIEVTLVEKMAQITPNLDEDMAIYFEKTLAEKDFDIIKRMGITEIFDDKVVLENGSEIKSDIVVLATGVRPNVELAKATGIELGVTGAIKVDPAMRTNIDDIYACGDCIETFLVINGKPVYRPLGSTANKTGRIAGDVASGGNLRYKGNLGTGIFKIFEFAVGSTGLTEKQALEQGYEIVVSHNIKPNQSVYYGGKELIIKSIADRKSQKILGVQIIGQKGVDKRIDVFATLITYGAKVDELFHLDLAYAPPFSTTKDPVHYSGMILDNALNNERELITSKELRKQSSENFQIIDARINKQYDEAHVEGAENYPHAILRDELNKLDKEALTITYCNKGVTGNAVQNILRHAGFKKVYNLSGGHKFYKGTQTD